MQDLYHEPYGSGHGLEFLVQATFKLKVAGEWA